MKKLKIAYYISLTICVILLVFYLLMGGIAPFYSMLNTGLYVKSYQPSRVAEDAAIEFMQPVNRAFGFIFVASVIIGISSILLSRLNKRVQYITGIVCGSAIVIMILIPKVVRLFLM